MLPMDVVSPLSSPGVTFMPRISIAKEDGIALLDVALHPRKAYLLGRSRSASIRLDAPSISRHHAVLMPHGGRWVISDLGSTRGLRTDSGRVLATTLREDSWVAMGAGFLWFQEDAGRTGGEESGEKGEETRFSGQVVLLDGPSGIEPRIIRLDGNRPVTIGSSTACDITVEDADLEPLHLGIFAFKDGWRVASMCERELGDEGGRTRRSTPLELKTPVFAGSLRLRMLAAETGSPSWISEADPGRNSDPDIDFGGEIDLEAIARSGQNEAGEQSTAA
jgi:pSer/pThr/pTyr-binding forkhead associated (FHA) protein